MALRWWRKLWPGARGSQIEIPREVAKQAAEHLLEMERKLAEIEALHDLERFARDRTVPAAFFGLLREALAAYDRYIETTIEKAPLAIRCEVGCTACCHDVPTGVTALELLHIHHRYYPRKDFRRLHQRACALTDLLYEELQAVAPGVQTLTSGSKAFQKAQMAFRRRREPCMFLDPDTQRCRVYEARPIPCRMHYSLSEPQWCWPDHARSSEAVTPNLAPPPAIKKRMDRIGARMGLDELSPTLFQGIAELGSKVLEGGPVYIAGKPRKKQQKR